MRLSRPISLFLAVATLATAAQAQFDFGGGDSSLPPLPAWQSFHLNPKARVKLDFRNASVDAVTHVLSQASGIPIVKDPTLKGGITLQSPTPVSLSDAFAMLNAALGLQNYEIVHQGNFLLIQQKQQRGGRGGGNTGFPGGNFPGNFPTDGGGQSQTVLRVYKIKYASASQVAKVINDVFATTNNNQNNGFQGGPGGVGAAAITGFGQGGFGGRGGRGFGGRGGNTTPNVKASSEDYSNSVIVNAPNSLQSEIADIISQVDQPTQSAQSARVFKLQYAAASDLQSEIQNVVTNSASGGRGTSTNSNQNQSGNRGGFGGFGGPFGRFFGGGGNGNSTSNGIVAADTRSNSLIVTSTADTLNTVAQVIQQLDKPVSYKGTTFIYTLKNARADVTATLINNAFGNKLGGSTTNPGGSVTGTSISQALSSSSSGGSLSLNSNTNRATQQTNNTTRQASTDTQITTGKDAYGRIVNVRDLTGQITTIADIDHNSVIVVTSPENWPLIKNILDELDRVPKQVMIEALVVEATLDKKDKLGVEWNFAQGKPFGINGGTATGGQSFGLASGLSQPQGFTYTLNAGQYSAFVQAVGTDTKFNVLSTPRIFTTNNASAQINISQSIPYITSSTTDATVGTTFSYSFLDVGIVLTVTPRITSNGFVTMDVTQTANDLVGYVPLGNLSAPEVNQREAETTVSVKNGDTVVLGGIMQTQVNDTTNKVPLLGDIPLLGNLFKSSTKEKQKTELLVFLTPRVVSDPTEAKQLREDSERDLDESTRKSIPNNINVSVTNLDNNPVKAPPVPANGTTPVAPPVVDGGASRPLINGEIPTTFVGPDGKPLAPPDDNGAGADAAPAEPNGQGANQDAAPAPVAGAGNAGGDGGAPAAGGQGDGGAPAGGQGEGGGQGDNGGAAAGGAAVPAAGMAPAGGGE